MIVHSGKSSSTIHLREIVHINLARGWRGGENQTFLLIKALANAGYKQTLITRHPSALGEAVRRLETVRVSTPFRALFLCKALAIPAVAHAHEARAVYIAYLLQRLYRIPYVITRRMDRRPKNRLFTRKAYSGASALVGISTAAKDCLSAYLPESQPEIIPSCHSTQHAEEEKTTRIRATLLADQRYLIGHAGALVDSDKGQTLLIDAVRILQDKGMRISLVFMGDGPDAEMLKNRARSLRSVHFLGHLPDITNHIAALDAFIFPSRKEGLGSVLLDVMRCRTPIIATNVGGIPDLITDDQTGILCASGNAEQLSQKIKELLSSKEKMQSIRDNAYKKSREYAPQIMAEKYLNIYQRITLSQ